MKLTRIAKLSLVIISGLLVSLPFAKTNFWFFAWIGFVPLLCVLSTLSRLKAGFAAGISGFVFWISTLYWLCNVTVAGTMVLCAYVSLYWFLFGYFSAGFLKKQSVMFGFVVGALWTSLEFVRSYALTGFPWALLGYSQYTNTPIIQIADLTGAWGVSFLIVLVNYGLYSIVRYKRNRLTVVTSLGIGALVLIALMYGIIQQKTITKKLSSANVRVSFIQPNIAQELKWDIRARGYIFDTYNALTKDAASTNPDFIIWPEAAAPGILGEDDDVFENIFGIIGDSGVPVLMGAVVKENSDYFNSALFISGGGLVSGRYDKLHLVPFGEYIPLKRYLPFLATFAPIGDIKEGSHYTIFSTAPRQDTGNVVSCSVLICFEDLFPELSREFIKRGASFLVNITNDAWYKDTSASFQHVSASVFRAVENRVYLVRSANTGISALINPLGRIESYVSDETGKQTFVRGFKTVSFDNSLIKRSVYTHYGDWFALLLCGVCVISIGVYFKKHD